MTPTPYFALASVVLDSSDARKLASFYRQLLGWSVVENEPGWVKLTPPGGGPGLSFQSEPAYIPPTWPSDQARQQMQLHLDIAVDDLEAAGALAAAAGATLADYQPQETVRVFLDPAGHPFCLFHRERPK
ncbi:MAG: VOC family protein [Dehalococcoidia bacterium]|jgi:catechol 2,3-dioxygenase-like lactoylglutathione lyase family enzyme|nr:VOC family protein [Dehalococcoidia bacterium]